jgi:hypothetical protein
VFCFGIAVAFAVGALHVLMQPGHFDSLFDAAMPAIFGSMFLLGSVCYCGGRLERISGRLSCIPR